MSQQAKVLVLGSFDGVHLGHQALIRAAAEQAKALPAELIVLSFNPHPREILNPPYLRFMSLEDQSEKMKNFFQSLHLPQGGRLEYIPFDHEMASWSAETFMRWLKLRYEGTQLLAVGQNFRFAKNREGDVSWLHDWCKQEGWLLYVQGLLPGRDGEVISTTRLKQALQNKDFEFLKEALGHPFFLRSHVVTGRGVGRTWGIPTANFSWPQNLLAPPPGVYVVCGVGPDGRREPGVANWGTAPTLQVKEMRLEVHFLHPQSDLVGQVWRIEFHSYLRSIQAFDSLSALQEQIRQDIALARRWWKL